MKKRYDQTHLQRTFAELERQGLSAVHSAMAHNIFEYRIRGRLPYLPSHKEGILRRIGLATPGMVGAVERIFKSVGV